MIGEKGTIKVFLNNNNNKPDFARRKLKLMSVSQPSSKTRFLLLYSNFNGQPDKASDKGDSARFQLWSHCLVLVPDILWGPSPCPSLGPDS